VKFFQFDQKLEQFINTYPGLLNLVWHVLSTILLTLNSITQVMSAPVPTDGINDRQESRSILPHPFLDQYPKDGIYFYGQVNQPEQIGKEYFVFELHNGKVRGAFYLPHSSFYCFFGDFQKDQLDLTVIDSFAKENYPYKVNLNRYYRLKLIDDRELRILRECKS
jgi:hypothetical protein